MKKEVNGFTNPKEDMRCRDLRFYKGKKLSSLFLMKEIGTFVKTLAIF